MPRSSLGRIIISLVVLGGGALLMMMRPHAIPVAEEANRIWHSDGYSFIAPAGWKMTLETEQGTLNHANRGWLRADPEGWHYYPPSLVLTCLRDPPDAENLKFKEGYVDGTFQNKPVLIWFGRWKKIYIYKVIFQDRDRWFEFALNTPDYYDVPHSGWNAFFESYRYEPERAVKGTATTAPVFKFSTTFPVGN
jgi:hypothetical protein